MAKSRHVLQLLTTAAVLTAAPALAQEVVSPPIEIGAMASGVVPVSFDGGAFGLAAGGATVTYNLSRRIGVEAIGEIVGPHESSGLYGIYQLQGRFQVQTNGDGSAAWFVTGGLGGFFYTQHQNEYRQSRPDGSIVVYPGFRRSEIDAPRLVSGGLTHRRVLNRRMSLLLSTQVLFGSGGIAPRASAGLSFGVRKYR